MRPGQQNKRGRGRGNNNNNGGGGNGNNFNRKGSNPLTRTYDSSGPDVKIRGTAQHIAEKYSTLARDAHSAGDRVMAENYLQHAEHYNRIIATAQAQMQDRFQRDDRGDYSDRDGDDMDNGDGGDAGDQSDGSEQDDLVYAARPQQQQPQPQPREQRQHQQPREQRRERPERSERPERPERERPAPVAQQPIIDDNTPQPVIEGTPAEVAMEGPAVDTAPRERATQRRRGTAGRPRRQPRTGAEGGDGDAQPSADGAEPALASE